MKLPSGKESFPPHEMRACSVDCGQGNVNPDSDIARDTHLPEGALDWPTLIETDVKSCARCGNDHPALRFAPFIFGGPPDASHWATCPQLQEPILLSIESLSWPGERCKRCGRRNNIGFSVPAETWAAVVRERWNVLCPACFDEEAEAAGIAYRFADPAAVSWSDWRDDDEPIRCGTFSEESLSRKPEQQAPAHVRAFGRSLRALREDFGLTLGDLADILGVRVSRVSDVERGIQRATGDKA